MSPTRNLTDAIRQFQQAEQKVVSVRDAILSLQEPSLCDSRPREQPIKYARADTTSDALVVANHRPQEPAEAVDTEVNPASTGSQNDVTASAKHNQMLPAVYSCLGQVGGSKTESDPDPARVAKIRTRPGRVHPDYGQEVRIVAEHTPMLPPTVKAHDKRGQPRSCRIHPDDGALQDHQPGRCWPAHERQRQGWLPTDPPDKVVPESCSPEKDHPPNEMKLLRFLNRGEYVRYHRKGNPAVRTTLRPPCQVTAAAKRQNVIHEPRALGARVRTRPTANEATRNISRSKEVF